MKGNSKRRISKPSDEQVSFGKSIDYTFLFLIMLILSIGLVMLLSASAPAGASKFGNSYHFFVRQLVFVVPGFIGMVVVSKIDYHIYKKNARTFFGICTFLLILVAIPGIGQELNGSRRWIQLPGFQFQPSEFMKLAITIMFANMISSGKYNITKLNGCVPFGVLLGIVAVLMILEPHVSALIIMCGIGVWIMISAGTPVWPFVGLGLAAGSLGTIVLMLFDANRWSRILAFVNPFSDIRGSGYQIAQALYAMGSGGLFGRGLGQSVQKYSYLPEPYNDFIFSIACEELGFFGAIIIIGLFASLILRGFRIALNAPDSFGTLLATGIVAQIAIQTTLNIAVTTSTIPNTGVSLPFFSYGGTAILILLIEMGILLNISRHSLNDNIAP